MIRASAVLDTNVVVSALLWRGLPGRLIELAGEGELKLFTSAVLLKELAATLSKPKLAKAVAATRLDARTMLRLYGRIAHRVHPLALPRPVSRDWDDDAVLACAAASRADMIVTGDDDLLVLKHYGDCRIFKPQEALRALLSPE
ncbi:MAG: putative toxin-antitoxin system toxin component, PIN family [Aquincola tertiaricarbonis]|uniref:putative toxin-antitoxin system toxin component, PIN family n=1 Tax=Aquincola sp. J276 TaxID=2898432 RepID=UPI002150B354|nr:putative toxin-antitoxin system toxin component, PIN family [Aquincola sp. J276]MCR5866634.1 putative toxin-antitoxin system toxin component, PIN family [Aquincola sp. J276]